LTVLEFMRLRPEVVFLMAAIWFDLMLVAFMVRAR
jgi:hypothetical protein